jgi:hypothetical protein
MIRPPQTAAGVCWQALEGSECALPRTWASMLAAAWAMPKLPVSARPRVTAGFICPPDRWPVA